MTKLDAILSKELQEIRKKGLYREMRKINSSQGPVVVIDGQKKMNFASNNYLGLSFHPEVINAQIQALKEFGASSGASRLISGNMALHEKLEKKIAAFKGTQSAIVFPAGYMANLGVISSLAGEGDVIVCDKLNHASIIDGARLSGALLRVYPHKNLTRLREILKKCQDCKKILIITDGLFSMDGDIAPVRELMEIAKEFGAFFMVDDAHATGVLGKNGRGTCEHLGIKKAPDIQMGTLSKALGNLGGFIAGSTHLIEYIRNKARSFIYSTGLLPAALGGSIKAIEIIEKDPGLRQRLWNNSERLRQRLIGLGFDIMGSKTHIIPIVTGEALFTMKCAEFLFKDGVFAPGIRPPTVAKDKCRIRVSVMATHTDEHIDRAMEAFSRLKKKFGVRG